MSTSFRYAIVERCSFVVELEKRFARGRFLDNSISFCAISRATATHVTYYKIKSSRRAKKLVQLRGCLSLAQTGPSNSPPSRFFRTLETTFISELHPHSITRFILVVYGEFRRARFPRKLNGNSPVDMAAIRCYVLVKNVEDVYIALLTTTLYETLGEMKLQRAKERKIMAHD